MQNNSDKLRDDIILFKKVTDLDKYNFYEYLSVMLNSGVGIIEGLTSVLDKIDNIYFKQRINELLVFINSGDSLSKAMKKDPNTFGINEISIVEAGEATGNLDKSLADLSKNLRDIYELKKKIKGALTYPFIIFLFLLVAVIVILTYVIPNLQPLFDTYDATLPFATQALISTSDFVINNGALLILFLLFLIFSIFVYGNTKTGKENLDNFILNFPLIGNVYKNYVLSNISLSMGNLIGAGVSTLKMLKLVGKSSGSYVYTEIFNLISKRVEAGDKIVEAMKEIDVDGFYFPTSFIQLMSVGEKTANLEQVSLKINKQYNREVEYSLANLTKWIEPLAVLLASVFVLWFAFAIFGAIMELTSNIG